MSMPFRDSTNRSIRSNGSSSSYVTASATSFDKRTPDKTEDVRLSASGIIETVSDEDMSILENNISMMSVSSPVVFTPSRKVFPDKKEVLTPGEKLIRKIPQEHDRLFFRELYPEMFVNETEEKVEEPAKPEKPKKKTIPITLFEESEDDKENIPPPKVKPTKKETVKAPQTSRRHVSDTDSDDDEFEKYLEKLKNDIPKKEEEVVKPTRKPIKKFVVEDDYFSEESDISGESDISEDEESEEDSSYRESSPEVEIKTTTKYKKHSDDDEYFLQSLTPKYYEKYQPHKDSVIYTKEKAMRKKNNRENLTEKLVEIFKRRCFPEIRDDQMKVTWNARLYKTAGQCVNHSNGTSTIQMSATVCSTAERIRDTLVHELCHAAVWVVDRLHKEGHGPGWKRWAARCMRTFKSLPLIERCHNYDIEAKFLYICERETCKQTIKRQSKSLDITKKVCGRCSGRFLLYRVDRRTNEHILVTTTTSTTIETTNNENTKIETTTETTIRKGTLLLNEEFNEFVKENYWNYSNKGLSHSQIMDQLKTDYK